MPLMNIFEPLFVLLVLVTVITLVTAAVLAVGGKMARAGRIVRRLDIGTAVYFAVVIAVSIVSARREYHVGDPQCFDDWCITVVEARRTGLPPTLYEVSLRLSNRARRMPMGEKGTVVYLTDTEGRRYDPLTDPADVPLDTMLQPGQSVVAKRRFDVPPDAQRDLGLVYTREGGFPIGWFIITEGGWFHAPPIVRLSSPE